MTILHTILSPAEIKRLSQRDNTYLRRKIDDNCMLSNILNKSVNKPLLAELRYVLDRQPLPRQKVEQYRRNSKVSVYNAEGRLMRIEHCNGKVLREIT